MRPAAEGRAGGSALFVYGTLVLPEVEAVVAGRRHDARPAVLEDHEALVLKGAPYPGLVPRRGARARGRVLLGVGRAALARIDAYEDDIYERRRVVVALDDGTALPAEAYVVRDGERGALTSRRFRTEEFASRHLASFLNALSGRR